MKYGISVGSSIGSLLIFGFALIVGGGYLFQLLRKKRQRGDSNEFENAGAFLIILFISCVISVIIVRIFSLQDNAILMIIVTSVILFAWIYVSTFTLKEKNDKKPK